MKIKNKNRLLAERKKKLEKISRRYYWNSDNQTRTRNGNNVQTNN